MQHDRTCEGCFLLTPPSSHQSMSHPSVTSCGSDRPSLSLCSTPVQTVARSLGSDLTFESRGLGAPPKDVADALPRWAPPV
jgi:hypothetical protein